MATDDAFPEALIESVRVHYQPDGRIDEQQSTIEVRVNFNMVDEIRFEPDKKDYNDKELEALGEKYDSGEFIDAEYFDGAYARLRYAVEDGVARISSFKDAEPSKGNWISFEFLRVADAADQVIADVPGVDRVEPTGNTLGSHLSDGQGAEIESA